MDELKTLRRSRYDYWGGGVWVDSREAARVGPAVIAAALGISRETITEYERTAEATS